MEEKGILPFDSLESLLEKDAEKFIEEIDDPTEPIDISKFESPPRPLIELKPLPVDLHYAFLHGDSQSPMIISDKLSEEESVRLITVLEKHRTVLGYSLERELAQLFVPIASPWIQLSHLLGNLKGG